MRSLNLVSAVDQVAAHLRAKLARKDWTGTMPGVLLLERELGVNRKTVEAALRQLEHEGLLAGQGAGRRRHIVRKGRPTEVRPLRVAILNYSKEYAHEMVYMGELVHELQQAGHTAFFTAKALLDLGMDVNRVAKYVRETPADAWVVCSASRPVLEWFAAGPKPAFALFGHRLGVPIAGAGPDKLASHTAVTRQLLALGHRRIVLLCREVRRLPVPGAPESAFLAELAAHGLRTGDFNLPAWDETIAGFHDLLTKLFLSTPPTALIVDEAPQFIAALQFLGRRRLKVPEQVSLVCTDPDPAFAWCQPEVAHICWDARPLVRRIVRWAARVSRGQRDVRQTFAPAEFVPGGTIGPAPRG